MRLRFCLLLVTALALTAVADTIRLTNGQEIIGRITAEDFEWITMSTGLGQIRIRVAEIAEIQRSPGTPPSPTQALPVDPTAQLPAPGEFVRTEGEVLQPITTDASPTAQAPTLAQRAADAPASPEPTGEEVTPPPIAPGYVAVLFMLDGETQVNRRGDWEPATLPMQLQAGNEILTGTGRTKIQLRGRGEVRLPPNTHLRLQAINDAGDEVTLELVRGSIWVDVHPQSTGGINFNVQTPDLTAGVRGTTFNVQASPEVGSRVSVVQGTVRATSILQAGQFRDVYAGFTVFCDKDGRLSAPEVIPFDLQREWEEWDAWALEAHAQLGGFSPAGAGPIGGLIELNRQDQQRFAQIQAEYAGTENDNRQAAFLSALAAAFVAYARDVRDLPPSDEEFGADGWRALVQDPGAAGWSGPYLPIETAVPVTDGWNRPITYRRMRSDRSGNIYGELISNGANGLFNQGQADDLRQMILLPDDVQTELRSRGLR